MQQLAANELTAHAALAAIRSGRLSILELARSCADRIDTREPTVRAWAHFDRKALLTEAQAADAVPMEQRAPLHGLVIGVKDIFDTASMPTTYGSRLYANHQPVTNSAAVALLLQAGAVVAGKTVATEFAGWTPSVTRNPHNPRHTPGGSSSGSAAAVADRMIPVALGTQTLGSVIRPASYCGAVGFKPSYGRISRVGVKPLAENLDTVGLLARDIRDVELVYRCLTDAPPVNLESATRLRLGFCRGPRWDQATPGAHEAIEEFVRNARAGGADIADFDLPAAFQDLARCTKIIHDFEAYRGFCDERTRNPDKLSDNFRLGLQRAAAWTFADYESAVRLGESSRRQFADLADGFDALITLSATGEAPEGFETTGDSVLNSPWTLLHAACVSIPVLTGPSGLPIGIQVVTPFLRDADALRAAYLLMQLKG